MASPLVIPSAEPFFFPGGPVGCLLIHGFTGTPKEMLWLGEHLSKEGFTVLAPRLPGHATKPDDMQHVHWTDWLAAVEDGLNLLKGCTDQQVVMGLSMGAALSLMAAARYPVAGVVAVSAPYSLGDDWRLPFLRFVQPFMPRYGKGKPDWQNPDAALDHIDYPYYPTRSIAELVDLLAQMRKDLASINVPALLVHSRKDKSVPLSNMEQIASHLTNTKVQTLPVENSGHVILREPDRFAVFDAITKFVRQVT